MQEGALDMNFCQYARGEAEDNSQTGFDLLLKTPGSKDLSLSNSLFSSPTHQPSTSLSGLSLQRLEEEGGDQEAVLSCLQESSVLLHPVQHPRMCIPMLSSTVC